MYSTILFSIGLKFKRQEYIINLNEQATIVKPSTKPS